MSEFREQLAWAAGFYDGEGCTYARVGHRKDGKARLDLAMSINQTHPAVLERLHTIMGFGSIGGPYDVTGPGKSFANPQWKWNAASFEKCQAAIAMMWPWLGPVKRDQAKKAMARVVAWRARPEFGRRLVRHLYCKRGHVLDGWRPAGRFCTICQKAAGHEWYLAHRGAYVQNPRVPR